MVSVVTVNIRFRNGATHQMSPWIRIVFLHLLPKFVPPAKIHCFFFRLLFMKRPEQPPKAELPDQKGSPGLLASPICAVVPSPSALAAICPDLVHPQPLTKTPLVEQLDKEEWPDGGGRRQRPNRLFAPNHIAHEVFSPFFAKYSDFS